MPAVQAKLVTIITVYSARQRVVDALAALGLRGFSVHSVEGHGAHGQRVDTFFEKENLAFNIVTSAELAAKLLEWVERDLLRHDPSIAYCADVTAVPAGHFQ